MLVSLALFMGCSLQVKKASLSDNAANFWVERYSGPLNSWNRATAIAIDNARNVYVTGTSWVEDTAEDYATIKYDTDGNVIWETRYNGSSNSSDIAHAIAVDVAGNVYVTGRSKDGANYDYATVKYDSVGNELWVAYYNGTGNGADIAEYIAVDATGNVYVTGYSAGSGTSMDYATVKYDSSGNQIWEARLERSGLDRPYGLSIDDDGNVYVTGRSDIRSPGGREYATVKYNEEGRQKWIAFYNGGSTYPNDVATAITLDVFGNVYVTGWSGANFATVKYDNKGNRKWVALYNVGSNAIVSIATDATGNVYVAGNSATVKYDSDGNQIWDSIYNGTSTAMALDESGNVYVTGKSKDEANYDYATVKYDSDGNQIWESLYNGPDNYSDIAVGIAVDATGNVYVTGQSHNAGESSDYSTIKYVQ
jgi:hypothetical protein